MVAFRKRNPDSLNEQDKPSESILSQFDDQQPVVATPAKPSGNLPSREEKSITPEDAVSQHVQDHDSQIANKLKADKVEEERKFYLQNEFLKQKQRQESVQLLDDKPESKESGQLTIEELYGPGKAYPEPYLAGKVPAAIAVERRKQRQDGKVFVYAVRFRSGPFGFAFDNRVRDRTLIEKVT